MNNTITTQIELILQNPLLEETERLDCIKDIILNHEFDANTNVDNSDSLGLLSSSYIENIESDTMIDSQLKTGFKNIDIKFSGFNLGEFVVIAARPGMGKTQFVVNFSLNTLSAFPIQYFTFDLSKTTLTNRFISCYTGISAQDLMLNQLTKKESEKLIDCKKVFEDRQIFINDAVQHSLTSFIRLCIDVIKNKGVKIIVIDYLQLVATYRFKHNREQQIALITRELKKLARVYNVCVIATCQLSRNVETRGGDKRPTLSDLRESGAIEQDADKVLFLYRPEYYQITEDENGNSTIDLMEVIIAKNNLAKPDSVNLWVNNNFTSFSDIQFGNSTLTFPNERLDEMK